MARTPDPILITGCARSGTSMVAGVINICGAYGGNLSGPNKNNAKGMFENSEIRNKIVKPYLQDHGYDKLGQYPLPNIDELWLPKNLRERVLDTMKAQGYDGTSPWFYKGAKLCLVWPIWRYAFPYAKWVIVRRRDEDIVQSCKRTAFMRAFRDRITLQKVGAKTEEEGWQWWVEQHKKRFWEMVNDGLNVRMVWPERMIKGDYSEIMELIDWLGLSWAEDEVHRFIEPRLWKARNRR